VPRHAPSLLFVGAFDSMPGDGFHLLQSLREELRGLTGSRKVKGESWPRLASPFLLAVPVDSHPCEGLLDQYRPQNAIRKPSRKRCTIHIEGHLLGLKLTERDEALSFLLGSCKRHSREWAAAMRAPLYFSMVRKQRCLRAQPQRPRA